MATKKKTPAPDKSKATLSKPVTRIGDHFFADVYEVVRQVPKGRVTTYGAIAAYLGTKLSARMVGWAMNGAHRIKPRIPAQRVINRNGQLSGKMHFETPTRMQELLEKEGIVVKKDTVQDFNRLFWDPAVELAL
jgi:methylated-DNA-protein-cysteine methyltransferase related protein